MSTPWPDLASLELLTLVAEHGSVGKAAAALHISQASASRRLDTLEARCGVPLLVRDTTGSRLTAQGALVVDWARAALDASRLLLSGVEALRHQRAGELRVAASMTIAEYLMPCWLVSCLAASPGVKVGLRVANSAAVSELVLTDQAEIGFVESPAVPRGLSTRRVCWDRLVVVVAGGHPWARRRQAVTSAELARTPLIVREKGSGTRTTLEHVLGRQHHMVDPLLELESNAAVKVAVGSGVAPAVLSALAVASELQDRRLTEVAIDGLRLRRPLRAVWPRRRRLAEPASTLIRMAGTG